MVMVGVFAVFATPSMLPFKQMGIGLAAAILIDATIVRAVLLPATMKLLGDRNWWLPSRLGWFPRVELAPDVSARPGLSQPLTRAMPSGARHLAGAVCILRCSPV
jgi:putative drug exporter of the RND superfamily